MLSTVANGATVGSTLRTGNAERPSRIGAGVALSLALHVLAAVLVIFGLPSLLQPQLEVEAVVPVDLVEFATKTAAPPEEEKAPLPQAKAAENAPAEPEKPVPEAQAPPPVSGERAGAKPAPKPPQQMAARPQKAPPSARAELDAQLRSLARLKQPPPAQPPKPARQAGSGAANLDASSASAAPASRATYGVKDFIRAQIERRWNFDLSGLGPGDMAVSIHLVLGRDGSVSKAEVVDDPRHGADPAYRALAISARNAALLSSPLKLPEGSYEAVKDIVLTLDPREVRR
jgi:outer membrane biosynthesis protein TonB